MHLVVAILLLFLAAVASSPVARLSRIPTPLVQIAAGAAMAVSILPSFELRPEVFFLLFLPPLLFQDGWRIPREDLVRNRWVVLELALGLVIVTVVGVGFTVHALIPATPLPVAFAIGAVLAPTDPIAVTAIARRAPLPRRMLRILEGEALLNDASGLVCLRFAIAAAVTGAFSLPNALVTFAWLAAGGVAAGVGVALGVTRLKAWLSAVAGEEPSDEILVSVLIPFAAYLAAERLGASGILAAAAAGLAMSWTDEAQRARADTRTRRAAVWDAIQFTANGVIFVLLGQQLPGILGQAGATARAEGLASPWLLVVYVLAITLALILVRAAWAWGSLRLTLFRAVQRGQPAPAISARLVAAMSLAGVRGAVTLAGILTLPIILPGGAPLPARALAIFLASGVIVASLVIASVGLPWLLHGLELPAEPLREAEADRARVAAARAAVKAIEKAQHRLSVQSEDQAQCADVAARVMALYRARIRDAPADTESAADIRRADRLERQFRLIALKAEREEIFRLVKAHSLSSDIGRRIVRQIDLMEERYSM